MRMSRLAKSTFFILSSLVFLVFSVLSVSSVSAQGIPGISAPLILTMEPANPKPLQTVNLSLKSFSLDIDKASISWTVNGKVAARGIGMKVFSVQAGSLGSSKTVEAVVATDSEGDLSQTAVIRPADLTLIWQAASYVPAFYKGKALLSYGGAYKVVALPEILDANGRKIDPRTLIYAWKKNEAAQQEASGYGKSYFVSSQSSFVRQGDEIAVEVTSPADGFTVSAQTTVVPVAPELHFYEDSPLYGVVFEKEAAGRMKLANEEVTLAAEPFFFSAVDKGSALLGYTWTLGGAAVPEFQDKPSITLRRATAAAGSASIGLSVGNSARLLQGAEQSLLIQYE